MRFHKVFKRYVPTGGSVLPEGLVPLGGDSTPAKAPHADSDNLLQLRASNINGFPVQRIVIGLIGPVGARIPVNVLVHDEATGAWFKTREDATFVAAGCLAYVDLPVSGDLQAPDRGGGAVEVRVLPELPYDTMLAPPGAYTFTIAGDVSSPA